MCKVQLRVCKNISFPRITTSAMILGAKNILSLKSSISYSFTDPKMPQPLADSLDVSLSLKNCQSPGTIRWVAPIGYFVICDVEVWHAHKWSIVIIHLSMRIFGSPCNLTHNSPLKSSMDYQIIRKGNYSAIHARSGWGARTVLRVAKTSRPCRRAVSRIERRLA